MIERDGEGAEVTDGGEAPRKDDRGDARQVTLQDVARLAGVHPATVSRTLNAESRFLVNDETAKRVEAAAAELRYRPNRLARALKTRRSLSIGVVLPDITNPLFSPIVRGIEDRLAEDEYTALLTNTDGDPEREQRGVEALLTRQVDGFILATALRNHPLLDEIAKANIPVVLVNRRVENPSVPAVVPNDRAGIALAVAHLARLGHTHIAHLAGPQDTSSGTARLDAFRTTMTDHGLDPTITTYAEAFTEPAGASAAHTLIQQHPHVTAIVASNDLIALGTISTLAAQGRNCPNDISVTGFNDMPFLDRLQPPLTTIHVPHIELGTQAADMLLRSLHHTLDGPPVRLAEVTLVVRGSTTTPPA